MAGSAGEILIRHTEALMKLEQDAFALSMAVRQLATLSIRASLVLGRSAQSPEDRQESAKIQAGFERVFASLVPEHLKVKPVDDESPR